jgi:hypothetical protein
VRAVTETETETAAETETGTETGAETVDVDDLGERALRFGLHHGRS